YSNWRAPERAEEISAALKWLKRNRHTFTVDAPRGVIAEFYRQTTSADYLVHLVNLRLDLVARNVVVRFNAGDGESVKSVKIISPDKGASRKFDMEKDDRGATIALSEMRTYSIVVITVK
ncbi:unnamed protein product, partial [marine sediment metagenome]